MKKAYEQSPAAVKKWPDEEYPFIAFGQPMHRVCAFSNATARRSAAVRLRTDAPIAQPENVANQPDLKPS